MDDTLHIKYRTVKEGKEAVKMLKKNGFEWWSSFNRMVNSYNNQNKIIEVDLEGKDFYLLTIRNYTKYKTYTAKQFLKDYKKPALIRRRKLNPKPTMKSEQLYFLLIKKKEQHVDKYAMVTWDKRIGEIVLAEFDSCDSKNLAYAKNVRIATKETWKKCIEKDKVKEAIKDKRMKGRGYTWTYKMIPVEII